VHGGRTEVRTPPRLRLLRDRAPPPLTLSPPRHTVGDTKVPFCLQSCVKPLKYAIAVHDHGTEYVHRFIGKEPSGLRFNKLFLNEEGEIYVSILHCFGLLSNSRLYSSCVFISVA